MSDGSKVGIFSLVLMLMFLVFMFGNWVGWSDGRKDLALKYNMGHYDSKTGEFIFNEVTK